MDSFLLNVRWTGGGSRVLAGGPARPEPSDRCSARSWPYRAARGLLRVRGIASAPFFDALGSVFELRASGFAGLGSFCEDLDSDLEDGSVVAVFG